jgi:ferredoxin, 2Fe-2S
VKEAAVVEDAQEVVVQVHTRSGRSVSLTARLGRRLMEVIRDSEIPVKAECGGVCACATCHVYVAPDWISRLSPPDENEAALLDVAEESTQQSRLSCQIRLTEALDGLQVTMAPGSN